MVNASAVDTGDCFPSTQVDHSRWVLKESNSNINLERDLCIMGWNSLVTSVTFTPIEQK